MSLLHQAIDMIFTLVTSTESEIHIVISDTYCIVMNNEEWTAMTKCVTLSMPIPLRIFVERPCVSQAVGRYIYVVRVKGSGSMWIGEFRVYFSKHCI